MFTAMTPPKGNEVRVLRVLVREIRVFWEQRQSAKDSQAFQDMQHMQRAPLQRAL